MSVEKIVELLKSAFGSFDSSVQQAVKIVTLSPQSQTTMWQFTDTAYKIILPIALTLAVLYFFIDLLNKSIMLEYMRWENVVKAILKLMLCKVILGNVQTLTSGIFNVVSELTTRIGKGAIASTSIDYASIQSSLGSPGLMDRIAIYSKVLPVWFIMWLVVKIILLIVYGRMIQIYIYTMFAPIPLAALAGEGMSRSVRSFIKEYTSVCLQGTIIIASMGLYGSVMKDCLGAGKITSFDGLGQLILISLVLIFLLIKSGDWAKKIIGGN